MVEWVQESSMIEVQENNNVQSVPAKLLCFYSYQDIIQNELIHSCQYQKPNDINTKCTDQWHLNYQKVWNDYIPVVISISVDIISGRVMVIEAETDLKATVTREKALSKVLLIRDRETKWIHSMID